MKTLSEINKRVWYRLVKVIFILFFASVLLIANGLIFSEYDFKRVVIEKTKVVCTYGQNREFFLSDINNGYPSLWVSPEDFLKGKFDYKYFFENAYEGDLRKIVNKCYPQEDSNFDVFAMQKVMEIEGDKVLRMKKDERPPEFISDADMEKINKTEQAYGSEKLRYLDFSVRLFNISPVFTHSPFLKIFLLTNLIILAVFEIFRRAFYYITLGSLRPKKD